MVLAHSVGTSIHLCGKVSHMRSTQNVGPHSEIVLFAKDINYMKGVLIEVGSPLLYPFYLEVSALKHKLPLPSV